MRRLLAPVLAPFVVLALLLTSGGAWLTSAAAAPHPSGRLVRAATQEVGDTVPLLSIDGDEEGSFTVTDLTDDFEDIEERVPGDERVVSIDVEIEADGADINVDPAAFNIIDDRGFGWIDVAVTRSDDKESLEAGELADGESVAGSLEIIIPSDVEIRKLLYLVDQERVLTLIDAGVAVQPGDPVTLFDEDGEETGSITADEVFEDFDDVERGSDPGTGGIYYGVVVTIENTGAAPIEIDPAAFRAIDANGAAWLTDDTIERSEDSLDEFPDLEAGDLAEGDSITGFVSFIVFEDVAIDFIAYVPDIRIYPIVDEGSSAGGDDEGTPEADDDGPLGPSGGDDEDTPEADDETPEADDDTPVAGGDGDCEGVAEWEDASLENIQDWSALFSSLDPNNLDPDELRDNAAEIEEIAETQAGLDTPPVAEELSDALVEVYEDSAQALNDLADGVEAGDQAQVGDAAADIQAIGESLQTGGSVDAILQDLREVCPDEVDQL